MSRTGSSVSAADRLPGRRGGPRRGGPRRSAGRYSALALLRHGLRITAREPMPVQAGEHNLRYLRTKRDRMGHDLPWLDTTAVSARGNS